MDDGLPPRIPFLPDKILHHETGCVVTGMEGELLWLDRRLYPIGEVTIPHPMRIHHATVTKNALHAMWLDRELLLAFMGSLPVGSQENGASRANLRTAINTPISHHPAGNLWSHSLDAEPMALAGNGDVLVFELYRRGLYCISTNAEERWRMASPTWQYSSRRPRNEETVALHLLEKDFIIVSKGGHVQRRSTDSGQLKEEYVLEGVEGPVEHHYRHERHELVATASGVVYWMQGGSVYQRVLLSGPIQHATWDDQLPGWRIAGWREEVVLGTNICERKPTREIPIHIHADGERVLLMFNDGTWANSSFEALQGSPADET